MQFGGTASGLEIVRVLVAALALWYTLRAVM